MYKIFIICLITILLGCKENKEKPNIVFILADDLGYGDIGVNGQKLIETPNIDMLAENGMLFTNHYAGAPVCAPSRCTLLTGKHGGHAYIRGNDEMYERGKEDVWDYKKTYEDPRLEGQRPLPLETETIAKTLKKNGYNTAAFGKWGLGAPYTSGIPKKQGFDYFYGYNCQRQAHNLYPGHLWENEKKIYLSNQILNRHLKLDSLADPNDSNNYKIFDQIDYAPEIIHNKALNYIENCGDKPFFMYYATPLPHLPLQAPKGLVNYYKQKLGKEKPYDGKAGYFPNQYPRATFAAMVTCLDNHIGELIQKLKEKGVYNNTIIVFSSDNGPTSIAAADTDFFESAKPFSNGYGKTKGFLHEGGIRVPLIINWDNHIKKNSKSKHTSIFYDLYPTICDILNISFPEDLDGISFKNELLSKKNQTKHKNLYWEFPGNKGQQAVRYGKWKAIRKNISEGNLHIELYDIDNDLEEKYNLAKEYPEIIKQIEDILKKEHETPSVERFKQLNLGD